VDLAREIIRKRLNKNLGIVSLERPEEVRSMASQRHMARDCRSVWKAIF